MIKIDFDRITSTAFSALGALLLTTGAFAAAAGPAMDTSPAAASYADAATMDAARA